MSATRKVTVELPLDLLEQAQDATQEGITQTIRQGLELLAARRAAAGLKRLRGKVRFGVDLRVLKDDRT